MRKAAKSFSILLVFGVVAGFCSGAEDVPEISFLTLDQDGQLVYGADLQGNRVPDFSHCGYRGADHPIPDCPVHVILTPAEGDDTERIQAALDYVASLPMDSSGIRGAVLLRLGTYQVLGSLKISSSGVILRGEGMDSDGTVLIAAGTDRRTLLRIAGRNDRQWRSGDPRKISDTFVPVGAYHFHLDTTEGLKVGDSVCIVHPATQGWIDQLGMNRFGGGLNGYFAWKAGSRDIIWDRVITSIENNRVTIDAPLTAAINASLGSATLRVYDWPGRIRNVGIENLSCRSAYDPEKPKDEDHAWTAVTMENVEDAWVRRFTAEHFAGSCIAIWESCKRITVEDCLSLFPVSEHGGYRRHTFFTMGQQTLFLRCWSEQGRHDFSVGHCAAGPNAFVQCESHQSLNDSGPIESWACGVLYDNVRIDGNALRLGNRGSRGEGIGWAAANCVLWQCHAAIIECDKPSAAWNWAFGCWGEFEGKGFWRQSNSFIRPHSLYAAQLEQRLGSKAPTIPLMTIETSSTTSPSVELAAELTAASDKPACSLRDYILQAPQRHAIPTDNSDTKNLEEIYRGKSLADTHVRANSANKKMILSDGKIICDNRLLIGGSSGVVWWRGSIRPDIAASFGLGITRFVPGRMGPGYTDDLDALTEAMIANGQTVLEHNYGLWYDRRRDDHQRVRRMNGDVRPPFYEQPFARSGSGIAWDGLSRYDLTKYNPWYWSRLKEFADLCDSKGLVLIHQNYFQHNILEAGAHWADFPWRPANNINQTGFPEPPPYAGDKRIYMDEQFYNTTHPVRKSLHRAYIRKCLENFSDNTNVIQLIGKEYTGPVEFVRFWLDTIVEWKQETGKSPMIGLSCTKDVQDQILSDPQRSKAVSLIDIRYWWYQDNGELYAPEGGRHLAPRQHARLLHPRKTAFSQVVRAVREYRSRYPAKAVIYSADSNDGWAVLMGGGSMPNLPATTDKDLLCVVPLMKPYDLPTNPEGQYALAGPRQDYLIYAESGETVSIDLSDIQADLMVCHVDLETGKTAFFGQRVTGGGQVNIELKNTPCMLWLRRELSEINN
ncbi:MAG: hypothetical protein JW860_08460 [Sedimentisphaerales bacterium]|nr:hypothetical protein [Sedimentisphaerales bacterium]